VDDHVDTGLPKKLEDPFMPTYEYACAKCGHEFEFIQSMKDKTLTVCPKEKCKLKRWGKGRVKKLIGAGAGLIFKGSGFYITDYRSENYKQGAKKEAPASSSDSSAGETKKAPVETKSAPAKSESKASSSSGKTDSSSSTPKSK
jgi:putative FmdB family regulatory protein